MPEELNGTLGGQEVGSGGGAAAAAATPASPTSTPTPSSAGSGASSGGGAAPASGGTALAGAAAPSSPSPSPTASEYQGVRDALAGYGVDLRQQFGDDHAALQHLALAYRQAQQSNQLAQYGQKYIQHAGQFEQWLAQQQQAQQAQQQADQNWFKAPEYDPRWQTQITRDPTTGELRPIPGAAPDVVQKYLAWTNHQNEFQQKLARDPIGTLKPGIEQVARQMAQEMISQHLGTYQQQTQAQQFVQQNSGWLHARDTQGQIVLNPNTGQPALSPLGQRFGTYVQEAEQLGLKDVQSQQRYAMSLTQRDYALAQLQGGQPAQQPGQPAQPGQQAPGQAQKDAFLANAAANRPNAGGSIQPAAANGQQPSQNSSLSLRERLAQRFQQQGFQLSTPIEANGR